MGLEEMDGLLFECIATKLDFNDVAALTCVSTRFRVLGSSEGIWSQLYSRDLHLSSPQDPHGNPTSSFKAAYRKWREAFSMYPWPLVIRVKKCWGSLRSWLMENIPKAVRTLRKGASEADIKEVEDRLRVKLPLSTRVLYRFCDGQNIKMNFNKSSRIKAEHGFGLIGGYSSCEMNHSVNVFLLPLREVVDTTKDLLQGAGFLYSSKFITVAASSNRNQKFFFQNCASGQLYVGALNLPDGDMIPCVPRELIGSRRDCKQDGMLLWLEEHSRRLHSGMIRVRVDDYGMRSISLFPKSPPLCSTAVTHGVQILASSVFVPELSDIQSEKHHYCCHMWTSLLREHRVLHGMPFDSCQPEGLHIDILVNDRLFDEMDPKPDKRTAELLTMHPDSDKKFLYEIKVILPAGSPGYVKGHFTFLPKRLPEVNCPLTKEARGVLSELDLSTSPFSPTPLDTMIDAKVARFPVQRPDYIF